MNYIFKILNFTNISCKSKIEMIVKFPGFLTPIIRVANQRPLWYIGNLFVGDIVFNFWNKPFA